MCCGFFECTRTNHREKPLVCLQRSAENAPIGEPKAKKAKVVRGTSQWKDWCFTAYHDAKEVKKVAEDHEGGKIKYMIFQTEVCPETGREHQQGYVCFTRKTTMVGVKEFFNQYKMKPHLEPRKGTSAQAAGYCIKKESRKEGTEPVIVGIMPVAGQVTGASDLAKKVAEGGDLNELALEYPSAYVRTYRGFQDLEAKARLGPKRSAMPTIWVLWGPSGAGKTTEAVRMVEAWCAEHKQSYGKMSNNPGWWDGYRGEAALVMNEMDGSFSKLKPLLDALDKWDTVVPVKGGFVPMRAQFVVMTSDKHPQEWYASTIEKGQLARRVTYVKKMETREDQMAKLVWNNV